MTDNTVESGWIMRKLEFTRISTTTDTNEPVVRAELVDTGSFMNVIIADDDDILRVAHVFSNREGDMRILLDETCRQLETKEVWFLSPLGKEFGSSLEDKLDGFESRTVEVESPEFPAKKIEVLAGEWDYNRSKLA